MAKQIGAPSLLSVVEGKKTICKALYVHCMLSRTAKGWTKNALAIEVQTCTETKTCLVLSGWLPGGEYTGREILPVTSLLVGVLSQFHEKVPYK